MFVALILACLRSGQTIPERWTSSTITGVADDGRTLHTKSRDYQLEGDLSAEFCQETMPGFLKIAFRVNNVHLSEKI